jgi:site-specific DNA-cytosine methylase
MKVSEYTAKCPQRRLSVPGVSHASRAVFQIAIGCGTWEHRTGASGSSSSPDDETDDGLLGTPTSRMWKGAGPQGGATQIRNKARGLIEAQVMDLLPTPRTSDTNGPGHHGTPTVGNADGTNERRGGSRSDELLLPGAAKECMTAWGPYEPAIRRWEAVIGRPAPAPTEPNAKGNHRLSPKFTEWMMGTPEGWITDVPISRNEQLKACGNGVVPQQAAAALKDMLAAFEQVPA